MANPAIDIGESPAQQPSAAALKAAARGLIDTLPKIRPPGHEAFRIQTGELNHDTTIGSSGGTFEFALELMGKSADAISSPSVVTIVGRHSSAAANSAMAISAGPIGALSDLNSSFSSAIAVTWNNGIVPAITFNSPPSTGRRSIQISDPLDVAGVARTDGGTLPLLAARASLGASAYAFWGSPGGSEFVGWDTRAAGLMRGRVNSGAGDQRAASSGWSLLSTATPVGGFVYSHAGPICNVMECGDSRGEGVGGTYRGEGPVLQACEAINASGPQTYTAASCMAYSGKGSLSILNMLKDIIAAGLIPDILVFPGGTSNDASGSVTEAIVALWKARTLAILEICAQNGILAIPTTVYPVNPAYAAWGATDARRRDFNTWLMAIDSPTCIPCDLATPFSGPLSSSQTTIGVGLTDDDIHPNNAGKAVIWPPLKATIEIAMRGYL